MLSEIMRVEEFNLLLGEFVKKYQLDGWELKNDQNEYYAVNMRRPVAIDKNENQIFANYYINLDQVFKVPVLSATFYNEIGHQLTHDELLEIIPEKLDLGAISEREHQITGKPVFFIHPCKTDDFIKPFVEKGASYFHVWMVRYGPVFLYRLPF